MTTALTDRSAPLIPLAGSLPTARDFGFWTVLGSEPRYAGQAFLPVLSPTGIIIELRSATSPNLAAGVAAIRAHHVPVALDPVAYFSQDPLANRYAGFTALPWGAAAPPRTPGAASGFCARIVNHCCFPNRFGVDILIAPYFISRTGDRHDWCATSIECALLTQALVALTSPTQVWAGAAITEGALLRQGAQILASLSRCPIDLPLYLLIATSQPSSSPLARRNVLQAIKDLITALASAGIKVIAGRRYSSGLALGTFGAVGWSTGATSLLQNLKYRKPGGGTGTRTDWYYVPELLDSVSFATRADLMARGVLVNQLTPSTVYARTIFQPPNELRIRCPAELRPELYRHNMLTMRQEAQTLQGVEVPRRRVVVRRRIASAQRLHMANPSLSQAGMSSGFLSTWQAVV